MRKWSGIRSSQVIRSLWALVVLMVLIVYVKRRTVKLSPSVWGSDFLLVLGMLCFLISALICHSTSSRVTKWLDVLGFSLAITGVLVRFLIQ